MFCYKCGRQLPDDAVFCDKCRTKVGAPSSHRETTKKAEVATVKCPVCEATVPFDAILCPVCGNELKARDSAESVQKFIEKLNGTKNLTQRIDLIKMYPIPNSREDILEFMFLASTNYYSPVLEGEKDKSLEIAAWRTKLEQCYHKAKLYLTKESDLERVEALYYGNAADKHPATLEKVKKYRTIGVIGIVISAITFVGVGLVSTLSPTETVEPVEEGAEATTTLTSWATAILAVISLIFCSALALAIVFNIKASRTKKNYEQNKSESEIGREVAIGKREKEERDRQFSNKK